MGLKKSDIIAFLATGFYSGRIPFMPGTWGTLVAIPIVFALSFLGVFPYMIFTIVLVALSISICEAHERALKTHDAKEIVLDEIVGFMVAMTWLPMTWQSLALGFFVFRFFDILKPFPISWVDARLKGGFGVVADDILAGIFSNILLQVAYNKTNLLGVSLL